MPKLQSPFLRKEIDGNYIVTNEIEKGYEWVFEDTRVRAIEKLHGCLHYQTTVLTDRGMIPMGIIVNKKLQVKVLSYNFKKNITEFKRILHYHKERNIDGFICIKAQQKYHGTRPRNLIVTLNHLFWTNNGWKRADKLKKGEYVYHLTKCIDFIRQQFVLGSLLGDSNIYWGDGKKNAGFACCHSIKQSKYFDLKLKIFGNILTEGMQLNKGYKGSRPRRRFVSSVNKHFSDFLKENCIRNDKKTIIKNWIDKLTPVSIAVWYMDDGSLHIGTGKQRPCADFATNSYDKKSIELIVSKLKSNGIESYIENSKSSKGNRLRVSADGSDILFNLISPYIIKEMQYKLPEKFRSNHSYWDNYEPSHENEIIPTKILKITTDFKIRRGNSAFQYDLNVEDNSNYFAGNILVHNTNVSVVIKNGYPDSIWNRTARIPFFNKGKRFIIDGILESYDRGYCDLEDGQWFGELIGPRVNGNPYKLDSNLWIPFASYAWDKLYYKSWGKYPKTFESISEWFKDLMPLFYMRQHNGETGFVEGIVFTHPNGQMAKLRIDMFDWAIKAGIKQHKDADMEVTE